VLAPFLQGGIDEKTLRRGDVGTEIACVLTFLRSHVNTLYRAPGLVI
jgi:hypothetical protein